MWRQVKSKKPKCSRQAESFGTPVLIWPFKDVQDGQQKVMQAYYGCRITNEPNFYLYGAIIHDVTHWMPLPEPPPGAVCPRQTKSF